LHRERMPSEQPRTVGVLGEGETTSTTAKNGAVSCENCDLGGTSFMIQGWARRGKRIFLDSGGDVEMGNPSYPSYGKKRRKGSFPIGDAEWGLLLTAG